MQKKDIKQGMVVKTRNNELYMCFDKFNSNGEYIGEVYKGPKLIKFPLFDKNGFSGWNPLEDYREDLTMGPNYKDFDIMEVFGFSKNGELLSIWKRSIETVMTIAEIESKLGIKNLKVVSEK